MKPTPLGAPRIFAWWRQLKAAKFKRDRALFWQAKGWADVTA